MTSSDERREVAARLRTDVSEEACIDYAVFRIIKDVLWVNGACGAKAARILSDLIEPEEEDTCCDVSDDGDAFTCSRCGCAVRLWAAEADSFENVTYGPTLTMPNGRGEKLSFCPNCGARLVVE